MSWSYLCSRASATMEITWSITTLKKFWALNSRTNTIHIWSKWWLENCGYRISFHIFCCWRCRCRWCSSNTFICFDWKHRSHVSSYSWSPREFGRLSIDRNEEEKQYAKAELKERALHDAEWLCVWDGWIFIGLFLSVQLFKIVDLDENMFCRVVRMKSS